MSITQQQVDARAEGLKKLSTELRRSAEWIVKKDLAGVAVHIIHECITLFSFAVAMLTTPEEDDGVGIETRLDLAEWILNRCRKNLEEARSLVRSGMQ